jgi:hypothetical protein
LANALPALFLFVFVAAWLGVGGAARRLGWIAWSLVLAGTLWLAYDRHLEQALVDKPTEFAGELEGLSVSWRIEDSLTVWVRECTPRNSVFITPYLPDFWNNAERAQVASLRHPPLDQRLIEWKRRLEALNGFQPYTQRGRDEMGQELDVHEARLTIRELLRLRALYGATHYMVKGVRADLAAHLLRSEDGYSVYDITGLAPP